MELWEVIAREEIRNLVVRYNSNGDSGRIEQVMELFADDAVMTVDTGSGPTVYNGANEIVNIFSGGKARAKAAGDAANTKPPYVRHFTATHQIDVDSETFARGRLYFAVMTSIGLDHWGRYVDTYKKVDGLWKFASRSAATDDRSPISTFFAR